jgi:hypothetical protein
VKTLRHVVRSSALINDCFGQIRLEVSESVRFLGWERLAFPSQSESDSLIRGRRVKLMAGG